MNHTWKCILLALSGSAIVSTIVLADTSAAPNAATSAPPVTTASIYSEPSFAQRMQECMAIWEKATHMTKTQWRRSCRTTLQSLTTD